MALKRINEAIDRGIQPVIGLALLGITLILCVNVITRYGFGYSLKWGEELATYTIIWLTFLGSAVCVRRGLHVSVDAFAQMMGPGAKRILGLVASVFGMLFSLAIAYLGWKLTATVVASGQVSPAMMVPMYIPYAALPVGGILMFLQYLEETIAGVGPEK